MIKKERKKEKRKKEAKSLTQNIFKSHLQGRHKRMVRFQ
jgi:hypothetical protein